MVKRQRTAIARIFSDLIKADRIVDAGEMERWRQLCDKYRIDSEISVEAQMMTLAEALTEISRSDEPGLCADFLADCRSMTLSDGFCAHSEAMLMIALTLMFDTGRPFNLDAISVPRSGFDIDTATALYIESDSDEATNSAIAAEYRTLSNEFRLAGFRFIYLPEIIGHYRRSDPALLQDILRFLAPAMSPQGIAWAYGSLMKMTTSMFCKDLLCNKCGITVLRDTYPALLVKISNSFVGDTAYADYLRIEVDKDIVRDVRGFLDTFTAMLSGDMLVVSTPGGEVDGRFHFHGFYKQLLDIFLIRKNVRSTVLVDPYREEIIFPDIDTRLTGVHRREKALYALLLCAGSDGLNFNAPRAGAGAMARYTRRMDAIQTRYAEIYAMFGGDRDTAPDLRVPEIRRPIFSCLRRALGRLTALYNPQDYNVTKSADGIFAVHLEPSLLFATRLHDPAPVPLHQSPLYRQ